MAAADGLHVALCEPYFSGSHQAWAEGLAAASRHRVSLVTHAGAFWKWRMQGAALTLAERLRGVAADAGPIDVLLVSDMVNVAALLGLARDVLGDVPVVLYLHENQLTYPLPEGEVRDLTYPLVNWLSMAAADLVVCNSEHHRQELFAELPRLLRHFPDHRHTAHLDAVAARTTVVPVGLDARRLAALPRRAAPEPPLILWNQRWEHDKDPAAFFAALRRLADGGVAFRVAVAGESFALRPREFDDAAGWLGDRLVHLGFADRATYEQLLVEADVVVSTARHDFFGVAVAEAVAAGAFPVLRRALNYPDLLPAWCHDRCLYETAADLDRLLLAALHDEPRRRETTARLRPAMARFDWADVAPRYDELLGDVGARVPAGPGR